MIIITYMHDHYYIWSSEDAHIVRKEHRIVGSLIGSLPSKPNQNLQLGLPLKLMKEEVCLLVDKGLAKIIRYGIKHVTAEDINNYESVLLELETEQKILTENESNIPLIQIHSRIPDNFKHMFETFPVCKPLSPIDVSFQIFCHFWEKGKFVTSGFKFGGHFLVYPGDPSCYHSEYIVYIIESGQDHQIIEMNLLRLYRLAFNVKKKVVVCSLNNQNSTIELEILTVRHPMLKRLFSGIEF